MERAYRRLGPRYPQAAVVGQLQLVHPFIFLALVWFSQFVDMSTGQFARLYLVAAAAFFVYHHFYGRVARPLLVPVRRWLEGERGQAATIAAWKACASLPREMGRREWTSQLLGALSYGGLALWTGYAAWELGLPAYSVIPMAIGMAVLVLYIQALRFFALEQVLRPVLEDIAREATDEVDLYVAGPSVRSRLLAALPVINVITGVTVAGLFHSDNLGDLALAVLVSAAVAATVSLTLTLLLSDSVTAPIAALHEAADRVGQGDFAARVPVVTTDETGALARSFNRMAAGLEQRERLREAFGTFVDPDLTERVLHEGTDLAGEEVEVSLLFMDIRGFTSYSEQADAKDVVARLNDLYGQVVPLITKNGGHANKFIGDGLLAVFGAPDRLPDHADRAATAGLEIARMIRERYSGELRVGIGVNSGRVVVGTIGGGGRLDFTVIGDPVNTAARVESATRQTDDDLLITEATRRLLSKDFGGWEERPPIELKGKLEEVRLYGSHPLSAERGGAPAAEQVS
ncbi:MAG: adenylate/guanylate cyclase domain-containing protein [Thermoleophilaceae bacterium]